MPIGLRIKPFGVTIKLQSGSHMGNLGLTMSIDTHNLGLAPSVIIRSSYQQGEVTRVRLGCQNAMIHAPSPKKG